MWRASESVTSAKQICSCKIDDLISAAVHNGADHVEAESQSLLHVDRRRHRELLAIHDHIHQCWPIVGQRLCQNQTQVFWPFYTDTKDVCGLSKFGEIGVNQVCIECQGKGSEMLTHAFNSPHSLLGQAPLGILASVLAAPCCTR